MNPKLLAMVMLAAGMPGAFPISKDMLLVDDTPKPIAPPELTIHDQQAIEKARLKRERKALLKQKH